MQVSVEATEGLERKMTIAVPSEEIETGVDSRLREAAKTVRLNGFRQGKVPFNVVKKRFGKGVRGEVIGELMSQSFYDAVAQEKLKPAGQPKIEPLDTGEGQDLKFVAIFEVYPDVKLPDFKKITVEKPIADVEDKDIDHILKINVLFAKIITLGLSFSLNYSTRNFFFLKFNKIKMQKSDNFTSK